LSKVTDDYIPIICRVWNSECYQHFYLLGFKHSGCSSIGQCV